MQSLALGCTQSVTGKKEKKKYKNIQNTEAEVVWSDESDARREMKKDQTPPHRVKTDCRLASSHSEEEEEGRRDEGGRVRKREEGGDEATRIKNRVTVWMQHTSLPLTDKAVKERKRRNVKGESVVTTARQSSV